MKRTTHSFSLSDNCNFMVIGSKIFQSSPRGRYSHEAIPKCSLIIIFLLVDKQVRVPVALCWKNLILFLVSSEYFFFPPTLISHERVCIPIKVFPPFSWEHAGPLQSSQLFNRGPETGGLKFCSANKMPFSIWSLPSAFRVPGSSFFWEISGHSKKFSASFPNEDLIRIPFLLM